MVEGIEAALTWPADELPLEYKYSIDETKEIVHSLPFVNSRIPIYTFLGFLNYITFM